VRGPVKKRRKGVRRQMKSDWAGGVSDARRTSRGILDEHREKIVDVCGGGSQPRPPSLKRVGQLRG